MVDPFGYVQSFVNTQLAAKENKCDLPWFIAGWDVSHRNIRVE